MEILGELRQDPFVNKHNITLDDEPLAVTELKDFAGAGGRTVVEPTCKGIGRDPLALKRISKGIRPQHRDGGRLLSRLVASGQGGRDDDR
jgi:predicted metal-dependent phosphotriesterase family hydrolase